MKLLPGRISGKLLKQLFKRPQAHLVDSASTRHISKHSALNFASEFCVGCGICVSDCPTDAMKIMISSSPTNRRFRCEIDYSRCIFCGNCIKSCPEECLGFVSRSIEPAAVRDELKVRL